MRRTIVVTINVNMPSLLVSWKTTIVGAISLIMAAFRASNDASFAAAMHDPAFQTTVILGVLGLLAKDFNTTGGTVGQPSSAEAMLAANQSPSAANPPGTKP